MEGAEATAGRADVRVVDVAVDDVRGDVLWVLALAHGVGGEPEIEEAPLRQQPLPLGGTEALAVGGAREQGVEGSYVRRARRGAVLVEEPHARLRQEADPGRLVVQPLDGRALLLAELEADGVVEVGAHRRRGEPRLAGVCIGVLVAACNPCLPRREEDGLLLFRQRPRTAAPGGEDERQAGPCPPCLRQVERVGEPPLHQERRIADHERRARPSHARQPLARARADEPRLAPASARAKQDARQHHARSGRQVEREVGHVVDGALRDDDDAPDRAARADGHSPRDAQIPDGRRRSDRHEGDLPLSSATCRATSAGTPSVSPTAGRP